jgi:hypothetical protein
MNWFHSGHTNELVDPDNIEAGFKDFPWVHMGTKGQAESRAEFYKSVAEREGPQYTLPLSTNTKKAFIMEDATEWNDADNMLDHMLRSPDYDALPTASRYKISSIRNRANSRRRQFDNEYYAEHGSRLGAEEAWVNSDANKALYEETRAALEEQGFDNIKYQNQYEGAGLSQIPLRTNSIRSIYADFDPLKAGESGLMKGLVGAGVAATAGLWGAPEAQASTQGWTAPSEYQLQPGPGFEDVIEEIERQQYGEMRGSQYPRVNKFGDSMKNIEGVPGLMTEGVADYLSEFGMDDAPWTRYKRAFWAALDFL